MEEDRDAGEGKRRDRVRIEQEKLGIARESKWRCVTRRRFKCRDNASGISVHPGKVEQFNDVETLASGWQRRKWTYKNNFFAR